MHHCKRVGQCMKNDEALLLPARHRDFISEVYANAFQFPSLTVSEKDIPSSRWLLSRLYVSEVHCRQRRYGTVLFHKGCDMIQALCTALGKSQVVQRQAECELMSEDTEQASPPNSEKQVQTVALYLNNKLHDRARTINASFNEPPEKIRTVNILNMMENTNSSLVKFLQPVCKELFQENLWKMTQEHSAILCSVCAPVLHKHNS